MTGAAPEGGREGRWFWSLAAAHAIYWTVIPALTQPNVPLDVAILYAWGRQGQWGYPKHPPLPAWVASLAIDTGHAAAWVYLASQVAVLVCVWTAWRLASAWLPPRRARFAALLLLALPYYSVTSPEYNNNIALMPCWALVTWFAWLGFARRGLGPWLGLGVAAGLGLLCKYTLLALLLPLGLLSVLDPEARRCWRTAGPWLAISLAAAIFAPHAAWASSHGWPTLHYAVGRVDHPATPLGHLLSPLKFALDQALWLLPLLYAAWPLARRRTVEPRRDRFLAVAVLGPLLLHLVYAAVTGSGLRSMWGSPFWFAAGVAVLSGTDGGGERAWRQSARRLAFAAAVWMVLGLRWPLCPWISHRGYRVHFPGPALARQVEDAWAGAVGGRLPVVAGPAWLADNVTLYSPQHPVPYEDLDPRASAWTGDAELRRRGGVLLWYTRPTGDEQPPGAVSAWLARFPEARVLPPITLRWQTRAPVAPVTLGLAVIPPASRG